MKTSRTLIVAAALVAGWAALWMARPSEVLQPGPRPTRANPLADLGVGPLAFHGVYACPGGARYAAFAQGKTYYPPNHPLRPRLIVEPARCFPSPVEAELAGYSLALPPAGVEAVEGFYLAPIDATLSAQCGAAARELGFEVPCPRLLPAPGFGIDPPRCGVPYETAPGSCVYTDFFVLNYEPFDAPPDYPQLRDITHGSHLSIAAFRTRATQSLLTDRSGLLLCPGAYRQGDLQTAGDVLVHGGPAVYLECGEAAGGNFFGLDALNLGHVVLMWSRGAITYEVSLHGHTDVNRELARYIANAIEYVSPGG